ncbi:MAG: hypothetical protein ACP5I1_21055, partial [Candidatus Hinthialibacter sp.]
VCAYEAADGMGTRYVGDVIALHPFRKGRKLQGLLQLLQALQGLFFFYEIAGTLRLSKHCALLIFYVFAAQPVRPNSIPNIPISI